MLLHNHLRGGNKEPNDHADGVARRVTARSGIGFVRPFSVYCFPSDASKAPQHCPSSAADFEICLRNEECGGSGSEFNTSQPTFPRCKISGGC
jgi:hypothetical protein